LSRPFRLNCVISFIFYLYLMLHACVQRFDVTENLKILAKFLASKRAWIENTRSGVETCSIVDVHAGMHAPAGGCRAISYSIIQLRLEVGTPVVRCGAERRVCD
jgi:hypothetical protein